MGSISFILSDPILNKGMSTCKVSKPYLAKRLQEVALYLETNTTHTSTDQECSSLNGALEFRYTVFRRPAILHALNITASS